jgi:hypothetical protein
MSKVSTEKKTYVICIKNDGCDDLVIRKIYQVLPDLKDKERGFLRVIDESGEDYLYPARYFKVIELSEEIETCLLAKEYKAN